MTRSNNVVLYISLKISVKMNLEKNINTFEQNVNKPQLPRPLLKKVWKEIQF